MRVMVLVKATEDSEAGVLPSHRLLTEIGKYNEELADAGVLLAPEGLHPSSKGVRVKFPERKMIDGPFTETKELVAATGVPAIFAVGHPETYRTLVLEGEWDDERWAGWAGRRSWLRS